MDVHADLDAPCPADVLFGWIDDLTRYKQWLDLVRRAEPVPAEEGDPGPAWSVDLRGSLGPLARVKRLRMVRAEYDVPSVVRFERREVDGRHHQSWELGASVSPTADGCHLRMHLHYGGALFGPVLERVLRDEIERSKPRLLELCRADHA
jgi:hypothetical protein